MTAKACSATRAAGRPGSAAGEPSTAGRSPPAVCARWARDEYFSKSESHSQNPICNRLRHRFKVTGSFCHVPNRVLPLGPFGREGFHNCRRYLCAKFRSKRPPISELSGHPGRVPIISKAIVP